MIVNGMWPCPQHGLEPGELVRAGCQSALVVGVVEQRQCDLIAHIGDTQLGEHETELLDCSNAAVDAVADGAGRLVLPFDVEMVESVLEGTGERVVVLGRHEHETVEPRNELRPGPRGGAGVVVAHRSSHRLAQMGEIVVREIDDVDVHVLPARGVCADPLGDRRSLTAGSGGADDDGDADHVSSDGRIRWDPNVIRSIGVPTVCARLPRVPASEDDLRKPARLLRLPTLLLNLVASHGNRLVRHRLGELDRRVPYAVLVVLEEFGSLSQAEMSRRTGIDQSDMVALVAELEQAGMVSKRPDETDRRRNRIAITSAGRQHLSLLDEQVQAAQRDLLEPLDADERARFTELLRRLLDYHDGHQA